MKTNRKLHLGMAGLLLWSSAQCAVAADDVWPGASPVQTDLAIAEGAEGDLARLLTLTVDHRILGAWSDGAGVNFNMGNRGGLHLELYSRRDSEGPGQRWDLNPAAPDAMAPASRFWSLGGSLDQVRTRNGGRQIVFVPQLVLDFAALPGNNRPFEALVQYANWSPTPGKLMLDQNLLQVAVRLQF